MLKSYPPDVVLIDFDSMTHARLVAARRGAQFLTVRRYRLPEGAIAGGSISPSVGATAAITEAVRRLRSDAGRIDRVSLLLPDSWFRMNILTLPSIPASKAESHDVVKWALRRTLPPDAGELRLAWGVIEKNGTGYKTLVVSALEKTLQEIEGAFTAAGVQIELIEPVGLNIWNAVVARDPAPQGGSVFVYARESEFTTAVFNGSNPLFIRSRNLAGDRSVVQELRLSASYLQPTLESTRIANCFVAGNRIDAETIQAIASEFSAPVKRLSLSEFADVASGVETTGVEAELIACTGVFTA